MGSLRRVVRSLTAVGSCAVVFVVLVVAAVALVGLGRARLAGAASSSTAALTAAAPWTWTNPGPALGAVPVAGGQGNGVSCVTVNHCVAVGDDGLDMQTDDGGLTLHWSSVPWSDSLTTLGYRLGAVHATPASCLAVSTSAVDDTQSHVYRSTDRGATWTDTGVLPLDGITQWASAVACDQNVHCVARGSRRRDLAVHRRRQHSLECDPASPDAAGVLHRDVSKSRIVPGGLAHGDLDHRRGRRVQRGARRQRGPDGPVLWGDQFPAQRPTSQHDVPAQRRRRRALDQPGPDAPARS